MKKAVYIVTAILAAAFTVFFVLYIINFIKEEYGPLSNSEVFFLRLVVSYSFTAATSLAFAVLSLMQLKKETPRLILLFSGNAFFSSTGFLFAEEWWGSFLYLIAGLLPAVYELIKYGRIVKPAPFQRQRYGGLLIAAGVLSCICIASNIYTLTYNMSLYKRFGDGFVANLYYSVAIGIILCIFTALFCFMRIRRTSVFYRMFLVGASALGALIFPIDVIFYLIMSSQPGFYVEPVFVIISVISFALVLLILIHAFLTRRDGLVSQERAETAQQAAPAA